MYRTKVLGYLSREEFHGWQLSGGRGNCSGVIVREVIVLWGNFIWAIAQGIVVQGKLSGRQKPGGNCLGDNLKETVVLGDNCPKGKCPDTLKNISNFHNKNSWKCFQGIFQQIHRFPASSFTRRWKCSFWRFETAI